ncbi:MAG: TRAP-type C4-dicarboxylate transport system, large permease component [Ignavibacteriae bacterium]|nr:MAG: TRAP-type C4-dicarboxylate transport system, large permease component [Ignavibacteriota bacterium]
MESIIYIILILLLALFGTPLFVIIGIIALIAFSTAAIDSSAVIVELYRLASSPTLLAIPLFTFAGYLLAESNSPKRIVQLTKALIGWLPGGLAVVALVSCAIFTAFTGASGVTIIALGGLLYPILLKENYPEKFSLGLLTTSGSLGLLFPPSLPIILYGMIAKINIDQLFAAGFIPGLILLIALSVYSFKHGQKIQIEKTKFTYENIKSSISQAIWEIPLPFIIIFGIYSGLFTVTEAAAITAFYVLLVEVFIYKDLHLTKDIPKIMLDSMTLVGAILIILGTALGLTNYLIDAEIPMKLFEFIQKFITSKTLFLILLNIFLLIVGMLMDIFSATIVVVPLIIPIATAFGVDPIHLGIIFLVNLEIGYVTPPVGLNLFISSYRFEKPISQVYRSTIPFILIRLIILIFVTYIPQLSLFLVNLLKIQ